MEIKPRFIITEYNDIAKDFRSINAWKGTDEFPYTLSSVKEREYLKQVSVLKLEFSREYDADVTFDQLFDSIERLTSEIIISMNEPVYLFISDRSVEPINRLRSYKGILPKWVSKENSLQKEVLITESKSIFSSLLKIEEGNRAKAVELFTEGSGLFMLCTPRQVLDSDILTSIAKNCMSYHGMPDVNFVALLNLFNMRNDIVFRMGGDGGNRYVAIQIFYQNKMRSYIKSKIAKIIEDYPLHPDKHV